MTSSSTGTGDRRRCGTSRPPNQAAIDTLGEYPSMARTVGPLSIMEKIARSSRTRLVTASSALRTRPGCGGGSAPGATSGRPRMAARILRRSTSFVVGSIEIESSQPILW